MRTIAQSIRTHIGLFAVVFSVLFTGLFSYSVLMEKSLRLDEAQTISQTSHTLMGTIEIVARDIHVPLYFVILRFWEFIFGVHVLSLRSFSLVFLLLSLPALYLLAREVFSREKAAFVVLLAGISPFLHWFGTEARMYSMLLLFTILSQYTFMKLWKGDRSVAEAPPSRVDWIAYTVIACLGMLTHYFFAFVLLVQALFYFLHRDRFQKNAFRNLSVAAGLVLAELAIWFAYRFQTGTSDSNPLLTPPSSVDLFNIFSHLVIGLQSNPVNTFFVSLWPLLILAGFTLMTRRTHISAETAYFLMGLFVPIVAAFVISATLRPLFLSRYLIICFPSLLVLIIHFLSLYKKRTTYVMVSCLAAVLLYGLMAEAFSLENPANENFRDAAAYVSVHANHDDVFVVTAPFVRYPVEFYYTGVPRLTSFPEWNRYNPEYITSDYSQEELAQKVETWKSRYSYLYVLMAYDQGYEEDMRIYLDSNLERVESRRFSPELNLYVYKLRYE